MNLQNIEKHSLQYPIIFYDGVCHMCNGFIQFVIDHDKQGKIHFCVLQDEKGILVREQLGQKQEISTVIGLYKGRYYSHSDVVFLIATILGGFWKLLLPLELIPKSFRDLIYNWIASNRYRWFGKSDTCAIFPKEVQDRFL